MSKRKHRGSEFREFLAEENILGEVEARALKRAIAIQLEKARKDRAMTKTEMANQMKTSRAAVDRLLDSSNSSVTLATLTKAARILGQKINLQVTPA